MAKTYARVEKFLQEHPWAILETTLSSILEVLQLRAEGRMFTDDEIQARIGAAAPAPARRQVGVVAVLPVFGVIAHRMNLMTAMSGGMSTEQLAGAVRQAVNDPGVSAIILDVDSPGGSVFGVQELGDVIFEARGSKPIVAVANARAASAAYWIASQADELLVTPSGEVGAIGAFAVHVDRSKQAEMLGLKHTLISAGKFKADTSDLAPLDDAARADMQRRVDLYYSAFVKAVARGRGVTPADVRDGFGEGRMVAASDAARMGMVDGIRTMDDVIDQLAGGAKSVTGGARAALPEAPEPTDAEAVSRTMVIDDFRRQLAERGA